MPEQQHPELIAIVAAMEDELAPLRTRVRSREEIVDGPRRYCKGTLRGVPVVLAVTGEGKRNADVGIRRLIQKCAPTRVLVIGLSGALTPTLAVGQVVVSSEVMEGDRVLGWPDLQWFEEAKIELNYDLGRIVTVDEILATPAEKEKLWARTVRDQPAVADMESACFARVALAFHVPYLIVRAVSDTRDEVLPHYLEDCRSQDGSIDRRQVMWKAVWRPRSWRVLLRLKRRIDTLTTVLADFAEKLVGALA